MSFRIKRCKKIKTITLPDQTILKVRLIPYIKNKGVCIWLVSTAISRSKRQINDWMNLRKSRRSRRLVLSLTGKVGIVAHVYIMQQLKAWLREIPVYDSVTFKCESAEPDRQFRIWSKWLLRHLTGYEISTLPEIKSVILYKTTEVEL